jgi:hypothetical protein
VHLTKPELGKKPEFCFNFMSFGGVFLGQFLDFLEEETLFELSCLW